MMPSMSSDGLVTPDMFCKFTEAFTNFLRRQPTPSTTGLATPHKPTRRFLHNTRWRRVRLLPYMDDFMFMADSQATSVLLRDHVQTLLHRLEIHRNPYRWWEPTHVGDHLGLAIYLRKGEFRAPTDKLHAFSKQASALLGGAAGSARWLRA
jgi:hypothetical protein